ncbi:hypothetical protein F5Y06DRAFT_55053 [Hypoxylon sp. FL0890]|nr:hypothetical protein F5Y06DRAFT_55053 [Hypoxylon sp. FL0890]
MVNGHVLFRKLALCVAVLSVQCSRLMTKLQVQLCTYCKPLVPVVRGLFKPWRYKLEGASMPSERNRVTIPQGASD